MNSTHFRIKGLAPDEFGHLIGQSDEALARLGAKRYVADKKPGFPDRIGMRDAEPGQSLILVNYTHQPADNAYHSRHAIFVLEGGERQYDEVDRIPEVLRVRQLSLRAFDAGDLMVDASLVDGARADDVIARMFADPQVRYIHAHYATRGCFACRIDRA
jgi:hypothetical protein